MSLLEKVEGFVNYLPRTLGDRGEERFGAIGRAGGIAAGYTLDLVAAGVVGAFLPLGGALPYAVGVASPVLYVAKKAGEE